MTTLNEMMHENAALIGDPGFDRVFESEHLKWLREGHRLFYAQVHPAFKIRKRDSKQGYRGYKLPDDVLKLHTATYDGNEVNIIMLDEWKQLVSFALEETDQGTPKRAFLLRTAMPAALYFDIIPDKDGDKNIKIFYWTRAPERTGVQSPELNLEYHPAIAAYARIYCYKKMKDTNSAALEVGYWRDAIKTALGNRPVTRVERTREPAQGPRF